MMLPLQKIVCPTDFSDPSYEGLSAANELAKYFSAELIIVHVLSSVPMVPAEPVGTHHPIFMQQLEDLSKAALQQIENEKISKDIKVKTILRKGSSADEIVRVSIEENADLIVIATHGQSGLKRWITGSVTEKVVRMAELPVLTIHPPHEGK